MEYPRTVILEDKKLKTLLEEKSELVLVGREYSIEIEEKEKEMKAIDDEISAAEKLVDIGDITSRAKEVTDQFNEIVKKMEDIKAEMFERIKAGVSPDLYKKYEDTKKAKEDLEIERNKMGLKIQQKNDKIIPLGRKLMKPYLEAEADDYDSIHLENEQIICTIFNHFDDFQKRFRNKNKN